VKPLSSDMLDWLVLGGVDRLLDDESLLRACSRFLLSVVLSEVIEAFRSGLLRGEVGRGSRTALGVVMS